MANLSTHLEKLRERPSHHKKRIAFSAALGITMIVGLIWVSTIHLNPQTDETTVSIDHNSPASIMKNGMASVWESIKSIF